MQAGIASSIGEIDAGAWNALVAPDYPFLQHDFLLALEQHNCLEPWGWRPVVFQIHDNDELVGACASYIKTNSYGEFVFDWAWAEAYQHNGIDYYPKLVTAIPFTPARGPRLLARNNDASVKQQLIKLILSFCEQQKLSSCHFLFCEQNDIQALQQQQLMPRYDYQYHWHNQNYTNFDAFLAALNSKRRKNIRRERRLVSDAGIRIEMLPGDALSESQWKQLFDFYQITFMRKSGTPTFTLDFSERWRTACAPCLPMKTIAPWRAPSVMKAAACCMAATGVVTIILITCILKCAITRASTIAFKTNCILLNPARRASTKSGVVSCR